MTLRNLMLNHLPSADMGNDVCRVGGSLIGHQGWAEGYLHALRETKQVASSPSNIELAFFTLVKKKIRKQGVIMHSRFTFSLPRNTFLSRDLQNRIYWVISLQVELNTRW